MRTIDAYDPVLPSESSTHRALPTAILRKRLQRLREKVSGRLEADATPPFEDVKDLKYLPEIIRALKDRQGIRPASLLRHEALLRKAMRRLRRPLDSPSIKGVKRTASLLSWTPSWFHFKSSSTPISDRSSSSRSLPTTGRLLQNLSCTKYTKIVELEGSKCGDHE